MPVETEDEMTEQQSERGVEEKLQHRRHHDGATRGAAGFHKRHAMQANTEGQKCHWHCGLPQ